MPEAGGTLRFELLVPGTYTVEARKPVDGRNVALTGNFAPFRDPRYPQLEIDTPLGVIGKTVDGNRLFAAGPGSGRSTFIFATTFIITAPSLLLAKSDSKKRCSSTLAISPFPLRHSQYKFTTISPHQSATL